MIKRKKPPPIIRSNKSGRKRRKKPWRKILFTTLSILFAFAALKLYLWATSTEYFAVKKITISGLKYSKETEVRAQLKSTCGKNIFKLKTKILEAKLNKLPYVDKARIYRSLPSQIKIKISERELLAFYCAQNGLIIVDVNGLRVAPPEKGEIYDLPLISNCKIGDENYYQAVNFLRAVKILSPQVYARISEATFSPDNNDLYALMNENAQALLVGKGSYPEKALKLWLLLSHPSLNMEQYSDIDLRYSQKIFITRRDTQLVSIY